MLDMQRKFIEYDREHGMTQDEYWLGDESHPLHQYRDNFTEIANKVVDLAHQEKGSNR